MQSENDALQRGDVIKKIDDYDVRDVRHVDAQKLLQTSDSIKLVIERSEQSSASRINITTSPPIIKPSIGNRAAVTSLSESHTTFIYYAQPFDAPLPSRYRRSVTSPLTLNSLNSVSLSSPYSQALIAAPH